MFVCERAYTFVCAGVFVCVHAGVEVGLSRMTPLAIIKSTLFSSLAHFQLSICSYFSPELRSIIMLAESEYTSILLTFKKLKWCLTLRVGLCKHQIPLKITWKRPLFWLWKNTVYLDGNICQEQTENVASSCYICFCKYKYTKLGSSVICHLKHWVWEMCPKTPLLSTF